MKCIAKFRFLWPVLVWLNASSSQAESPDTFSPVVSFLYEEAVDAPGTNTAIISPVVSFLFPEAVDGPGTSLITSSLPVSFLYWKLPEDDYNSWAAEKFSLATVLSASTDWQKPADPDQDGQSNFLEYALGSSPVSGAGLAGLSIDIVTVAQEKRLRLSWKERRAALPGLSYLIETSTDLISWSPLPPTWGTASRDDFGSGYDFVSLMSDNAGAPWGFFRLRVQ